MIHAEDFYTDCWAEAIEIACQAAANSPAGYVQLLRQVYPLKRPINLRRTKDYNNICEIRGVSGGARHWINEGYGGTVLKPLGEFAAIHITAEKKYRYLGQVKFEGFTIVGATRPNSKTVPSDESAGIVFGDSLRVRQITLDNIQIYNCKYGLRGIVGELKARALFIARCMYSVHFSDIVDSLFSDMCHFGSGPAPKWVNGGAGFHARKMHNVHFVAQTRFQVQRGGPGAYIGDAESSSFIGCKFDQNATYGLVVGKSNGLTIQGSKFFANKVAGIIFKDGVHADLSPWLDKVNTFKETAKSGPKDLKALAQKQAIIIENPSTFTKPLPIPV